MKKGEIYTGVVEKMDFPNKGVLHIGEEKVVVWNKMQVIFKICCLYRINLQHFYRNC